jgi:iron complex outermembrane receptor protein
VDVGGGERKKIFYDETPFCSKQVWEHSIEFISSSVQECGGILHALVARSFVLFFLIACISSSARAGTAAADCPEGETKDSSTCHTQKIEPRRESIVVTGTFEPAPLEGIDRSVSAIDLSDAPELYTHWVEYLQLDPSIDLRQRAPDGVQGDLSIRGSTFGQTLVLLNGLRMNDAQTGHHNLDLPLPTSSIGRIEILRGAGSTFYGSDAMAGAVNFITRAPEYSEFRVGAAVGNFGTNQQTASAALLSGRWNERLSATRDFSSGFMPDRDYRSLTIFSDSGVQTRLGGTLIMLGYGDKPFGANQFYGDFDSWERTKSWFAGLKQDLGGRTEFDLGYRRHSDEFILFRENPSIYENNHIDESWQAALRRKQPLGQNATLSFGGEGFHESIDSNNLGQHARSRGAIYVDYDMRVLGRFSFSAGAREEIYASDNEFSPNVSGGVWLKAGLKLKGSASRAFRLPTYTDLYYHDPANAGNPNLKPETAWSYEGGLVWDRGGRFKAEVTVFERREQNDIDYVRSSPTDIFRATNIQRLNFTGVETSFEMRLPRGQRVTIAYTGLHGAQQALNGLESKYVFNYPVQDAVLAWQGRLPWDVIARSSLRVTDRFARDPYALWDAALAREFSHVAAHLGFFNLTDTQYEEIQGVAMPGRSVVFGLELFMRGKGH